LASLPPYDLLLCGSDQIWNPSDQFGLDPTYFLDFEGASRARRASYGASFGKAELAEPFRAEAAELIRGLDAVSVRERSGAGIVRALTGGDPTCVPDPTILLGDFSELVRKNPVPDSGHVFCYALRVGDGVRELATVAAKATGGEVLSPENPHRRWRPIGRTVYPSPGEWLSLIASSAVVVTNSFHGVALSLILQRPFVAVALPGGRAALTERVKNLLADVGLEERLVAPSDIESGRRILEQPIDWEGVGRALADLRHVGEAYALNQLRLAVASQ
jgi:hypothetical protein